MQPSSHYSEFYQQTLQVLELLNEAVLGELEERPVCPSHLVPGQLAQQFPSEPSSVGRGFPAVLEDLRQKILPGLTHWQHPRFMAYFPSATSSPAVAS